LHFLLGKGGAVLLVPLKKNGITGKRIDTRI